MTDNIILTVSDLCVAFRQGSGLARVVDGVGFQVRAGEMLALVGESGSGKSVTALALLGLLPKDIAVVEKGTVMFGGKNLLDLDESALGGIRGNRIAMVFQEPMTALNPVLTVGWQIGEALSCHEKLSGVELRRRVISLLDEVGIPEPSSRLEDYPFQLSGGMRQRVMIAMALACRPQLIIADEPTTALDVTVQAQIMSLFDKLRREHGTAVLLITHNLALVRERADRVAVMYGGRIAELARGQVLFSRPAHPYTRLLLQAVPSISMRGRELSAIAGQVPSPDERLAGCRFAPRCRWATEECRHKVPMLHSVGAEHYCACPYDVFVSERQSFGQVASVGVSDRLLEVRGLKVLFPIRRGIFGRSHQFVHAVNGVSFSVSAGETVALVGESGCGKTTVGKALVRLLEPTEGQLLYRGGDFTHLGAGELLAYRRRIQMIFQDPFGSLDPRLTVGEAIEEGMRGQGCSRAERAAALAGLLEQVGLPKDAVSRYPHQFSGGQRQRIGLARALAVKPELLVCDECTSALDVSVQAQILNLLKSLQASLGLAYLFITHDLSVVSFLADRVLVMYLGQIVEEGSASEVMEHPMHPYTRALIASAPQMDADGSRKVHLEGEVPSPVNLPKGCPFHPRCPLAAEDCRCNCPQLRQVTGSHRVACSRLSKGNCSETGIMF